MDDKVKIFSRDINGLMRFIYAETRLVKMSILEEYFHFSLVNEEKLNKGHGITRRRYLLLKAKIVFSKWI